MTQHTRESVGVNATPGKECCAEECCSAQGGDPGWLAAARRARRLAWASLAWMTAEGTVGLLAGYASGSAALTGWAFGSAIEGAASMIVIWRFTGSRTLSPAAEARARRAVAVSFWLLVPYIAAGGGAMGPDRRQVPARRAVAAGRGLRGTVLPPPGDGR